MKRCFWVDEKSEIYTKYHDEEWGIPKHDDHELFELLILESFQAGLSCDYDFEKREKISEKPLTILTFKKSQITTMKK